VQGIEANASDRVAIGTGGSNIVWTYK
jgi:hypothetical protein